MKEIIEDWKQNSEKRKEHNSQFIRSLKLKDPIKVDKLAKKVHEEAFNKIDCLQCGNCCKKSKPLLQEDDILNISKFLKMGVKKVKEKFMELDEDNDWTFNKLPCPFLSLNNECKIYLSRPQDCREFPHTKKSGFASRSYQHRSNSLLCPATYYIVEKMKNIIR